MPPVVLVVGLDLRDGHKEGLFPVIGIKEAQGQIVDAVRPVALEVHPVVVLVEHEAVVPVGGELQHVRRPPVSGIPSPQLLGDGCDGVVDGGRLFQLTITGQVPFSDIGGLVARLLDVAAQGLDVGREHDVVAETARLGGPLARLEQGAAGTAHRLGGKGVVELDPVPGQRI